MTNPKVYLLGIADVQDFRNIRLRVTQNLG